MHRLHDGAAGAWRPDLASARAFAVRQLRLSGTRLPQSLRREMVAEESHLPRVQGGRASDASEGDYSDLT